MSTAAASSGLPPLYECGQCDVTYPSFSILKSHFFSTHVTTPSSSSTSNPQWYQPQPEDFNEEELSSDAPSSPEPSTQEFKCEVKDCTRTFGTKKDRDRHEIRSHVPVSLRPTSVACELCDRKVECKAKLVEHMRTHTGEAPLVCHLCGKGFSNKSSFVKHLRAHEDGKIKEVRKPIVKPGGPKKKRGRPPKKKVETSEDEWDVEDTDEQDDEEEFVPADSTDEEDDKKKKKISVPKGKLKRGKKGKNKTPKPTPSITISTRAPSKRLRNKTTKGIESLRKAKNTATPGLDTIIGPPGKAEVVENNVTAATTSQQLTQAPMFHERDLIQASNVPRYHHQPQFIPQAQMPPPLSNNTSSWGPPVPPPPQFGYNNQLLQSNNYYSSS